MRQKIILLLSALAFALTASAQRRIDPATQVQKAPGENFILLSDAQGDYQHTDYLLAPWANGGGGVTGTGTTNKVAKWTSSSAIGNSSMSDDGSINRHKPEWLGNFGRDIHHTAGDISKVSSRVGFGTFAIGAYVDIKQFKKKPLAIITKGIIIWGISSLTEKMTYDYLRK